MYGPGMVRSKSGTPFLGCKNGPGSRFLRREQPSAFPRVGVLLPGRRRLLRREDSEGAESEEPAALRKRSFSSMGQSGDAQDSSPGAFTDDVIYVKTKRVVLCQTFLTSWLIKKRPRVSVIHKVLLTSVFSCVSACCAALVTMWRLFVQGGFRGL